MYRLLLTAFAVSALFLTGCTTVNKISEYDFDGKTMAVTAPLAPQPEIFSELPGGAPASTETEKERGTLGLLSAIATAVTDVAKAFTAADAHAKLDSAAMIVDVSDIIARGIEGQAIRYLGVAGAADVDEADFLMEIEIDRHGIFAGSSYDGRLTYVLDGKAILLDNMTGRIVWRRGVKERVPFTPGSDSPLLANIGNTVALSNLTVDQLAAALERMSHDAARSLTRKLSDDVRKARK